jgi:Leucine-rich repeat (LRR) protein
MKTFWQNLIWLACLGGLGLVGCGLSGCTPARRDRNIAVEQDDIASYEWFLRQNPDTKYAAEIKERLATLSWEATIERDGPAEQISAERLSAAFIRSKRVFERFGNSKIADAVRGRLDSLAWLLARQQDRIVGYEKLLLQQSDSVFNSRIHERLESLLQNAVRIADPILDKVIRRELRLRFRIETSGELLKEEIAVLQRLDLLLYPQIRSLAGIEYAVELKYLRLPLAGAIEDLKPLTTLAGLDSLVATGQEWVPLDLIAQMRHLRYLDLTDNNLGEIGPLVDAQELEFLSLEHNAIEDLSPLARLTELQQLNLMHNNLKGVAALKDLVKVEKLWLAGNHLHDIAPLRRLVNLTHLHLADNKIHDINALRNMRNLVFIDLSNNELTEFPQIKIKSLETFKLAHNQLETLNVGMLNEVVHLDLSHNQLTSLEGMGALRRVDQLLLQGNRLKDLSGLVGVTVQHIVDLRDNNLHDPQPLLDNLALQGPRVQVRLGGNPLSLTWNMWSKDRPNGWTLY